MQNGSSPCRCTLSDNSLGSFAKALRHSDELREESLASLETSRKTGSDLPHAQFFLPHSSFFILHLLQPRFAQGGNRAF